MSSNTNLRSFAASDIGRVRKLNEDSTLADDALGLFIVADGMGGHAAGEVASARAVAVVREYVASYADSLVSRAAVPPSATNEASIPHLLEAAVQQACARVHAEASRDASKRGMGTTFSALLVVGTQAFIAHVGDSRIYLVRGSDVQQLTEDHTVFNELLRRGKLSRQEIEKIAQKNAITRAVGVYERVDVDTLSIEVLPGDRFILASDGFHGYIDAPAQVLELMGAAPEDVAARALVDFANDRGGKDNVSAVVVRLGAGDAGDEARARRLALKREVILGMPLFSRLAERELLRVLQVVEVVAFAPGQTVFEQGERGEELYIVLSGKLRIARGDAVLSEVGPGEHFGEMALVRRMPRSASVVAIEPSELIVLRRPEFFALLRSEHELAVKMLWQFLAVLSQRLDQTSRDLTSAREQLAAEDVTSMSLLIEGDDAQPFGAYPAEPPPTVRASRPPPRGA